MVAVTEIMYRNIQVEISKLIVEEERKTIER